MEQVPGDPAPHTIPEARPGSGVCLGSPGPGANWRRGHRWLLEVECEPHRAPKGEQTMRSKQTS